MAVLLLALPALGMGPTFSHWSRSICCFSNFFVHTKGDEAQSIRAASPALITVMSYLSRRHEPQCCPVLQQTQSGATATPLSTAHHRDLYSRNVGFDIYSLKANSYHSIGLMKEGEKILIREDVRIGPQLLCKVTILNYSWPVTVLLASLRGNNAAIIFVLI